MFVCIGVLECVCVDWVGGRLARAGVLAAANLPRLLVTTL